jgi:ABC-type phosphate transport system permease subunit
MDTGLVDGQENGGKKTSEKQQRQVEQFLEHIGVKFEELKDEQQGVVFDFLKRRRKAHLAVPVTIVLLVAICVVCFCLVCNFLVSGSLWGIPDEYIVTNEETSEVIQVAAELKEHMKVLVYFYGAVTMTLTGALFCGVAAVGSAIEMNTRSRRDEKMLKAFLQG